MGISYPKTRRSAPCVTGCACGKHRRRTFTDEHRANISASAAVRGFNHADACSCAWCLQRDFNLGDEAGYGAIHARLGRWRGRPTGCVDCTSVENLDWSFNGEGHEYGAFSTNLDEYVGRCRSCHKKYDRGSA